MTTVLMLRCEFEEVPLLLKKNCLMFVPLLTVLLLMAQPTRAQDWIHTAIGMSDQRPRIAVSDFTAKSDEAKSHCALFTNVVRDDLAFSGIVELASPSFYPPTAPSQPGELHMLDWSQGPVNANFLAFGNLTETSAEVGISAWTVSYTHLTLPTIYSV